MRIRGVFCGPSCAKSWAMFDSRFPNPTRVSSLIDELAHKRGYRLSQKDFHYIPLAPPREALNTFCGSKGMTIEQFRKMCAAGFDVTILRPPYITEKQVIVAECERMSRISKTGRLVHVDDVNCLMVPAAEFAKRRQEGLEIFAGIGARRLTDFIGDKSLPHTAVDHIPKQKSAPETSTSTKNGRIKRPLPPLDPQALTPPTKRQRTPKKIAK